MKTKKNLRLFWIVGIAVGLVAAGVFVWTTMTTTAVQKDFKLDILIREPDGQVSSFLEGQIDSQADPSIQTLADLLEQNDIHYGPNDIKDVFEGTFAMQQGDQLVVLSAQWILRNANSGDEQKLSSFENYNINDGDDLQLVYEMKEVSRQTLPEEPSFITYVPIDDPRNGKGTQDYLSCVNNSAIHGWLKDYQEGRTDLPDYPFNPPVCGAHIHQFPPTYEHVLPHEREGFILDRPIEPLQVEPHILGHGMTIIQYNPDKVDQNQISEMEKFVLEHAFVYLAPYPSMDSAIAMTRWGMIAKFDEYDTEKFELFQQAPYRILPPMHGSLQYYHSIVPSHLKLND